MNKYIHERYENKLGYGQVSQTARDERNYENYAGEHVSTEEILRKRSYAQSYQESQVAEPKISLMEMLTIIEKSLDVLGEHMQTLNLNFFPVMRSGIGLEAKQEAVTRPHHSEAVLYAININEKIGELQDRVLQMLDRNEL